MKCGWCNRLSLRPCRRAQRCISWGRVSEKLARFTYVSEEVVYSKACGKFVVPL